MLIAVEIEDENPFDKRFQEQDVKRNENDHLRPSCSLLWQCRSVSHCAGLAELHDRLLIALPKLRQLAHSDGDGRILIRLDSKKHKRSQCHVKQDILTLQMSK